MESSTHLPKIRLQQAIICQHATTSKQLMRPLYQHFSNCFFSKLSFSSGRSVSSSIEAFFFFFPPPFTCLYMLYTAFYEWVLDGQESSLVLHVHMDEVMGYLPEGNTSDAFHGILKGPLACRKPRRDRSRGVAVERCSMRWRDRGLIRKRTAVAQNSRREVLLEIRGASQRLLHPENQLRLQTRTYRVWI